MKRPFGKTQVDRLGDRLKEGRHTESDLRLLDGYRRSFGEAYEKVVRTIRRRGESPSGRLAKSTFSIVEKLRRESIRLSQMQDIAGCRIVVDNVVQQEQAVASLRADFAGASVMDRRSKPSYGYRAVHILVEMSGKPIEIQVRTSLQHKWAELSEKSSDVFDPTIKYGGGSDEWRRFLTVMSESVASCEEAKEQCSKAEAHYEETSHLYEEASRSYEAVEKAAAELPERCEPEIDKRIQSMRGALRDSNREMLWVRQETDRSRGELDRIRNLITDTLSSMISRLDERQLEG